MMRALEKEGNFTTLHPILWLPGSSLSHETLISIMGFIRTGLCWRRERPTTHSERSLGACKKIRRPLKNKIPPTRNAVAAWGGERRGAGELRPGAIPGGCGEDWVSGAPGRAQRTPRAAVAVGTWPAVILCVAIATSAGTAYRRRQRHLRVVKVLRGGGKGGHVAAEGAGAGQEGATGDKRRGRSGLPSCCVGVSPSPSALPPTPESRTECCPGFFPPLLGV